MDDYAERRDEDRLGYRAPIWFSTDFTKTMSEGLMVDISSGGIAFDCARGQDCPSEDQHLTVRFSIPRFEGDDPTATVSVTRTGEVCRVEDRGAETVLIAMKFDTPMAIHPSELAHLNSMCDR